jgi:HlyD family secretion protein
MGQGKPAKPEGMEKGGMPGPVKMPDISQQNANGGKMVWVKKDSLIRPVPVEVGLDDDIYTEIISGLKEGEEVITSMEQQTAATVKKAATSNPFMPRPPGANRR